MGERAIYPNQAVPLVRAYRRTAGRRKMDREGTGELTANEKKKAGRGATQDNAPRSAAGRAARRPKRAANDPLGEALRSVFNTTVDEAIPTEMLDLLGKLA